MKSGKQTNVKNNLASVSQTSSSDSTAIIFKDDSEKVNIKELPLLTFEMLANATDQFHDYNLLGKGGFGSVYRVRNFLLHYLHFYHVLCYGIINAGVIF